MVFTCGCGFKSLAHHVHVFLWERGKWEQGSMCTFQVPAPLSIPVCCQESELDNTTLGAVYVQFRIVFPAVLFGFYPVGGSVQMLDWVAKLWVGFLLCFWGFSVFIVSWHFADSSKLLEYKHSGCTAMQQVVCWKHQGIRSVWRMYELCVRIVAVIAAVKSSAEWL